MKDPSWKQVDAWAGDALLAPDPALGAVLAASMAAGLPGMEVSPMQGRTLQLFARMVGTKRILEIGTLGGYSTVWLARALPRDGRLVTLEVEPRYAEIARANLARAGVADRCELRLGPALDTLDAMIAAGEGPFDFVFIDADKQNNTAYVRAALALSRPGTAIVVDNVVREGAVLDAASADPKVQGSRAVIEAIGAEPRLSAAVIQTVGAKKWDGMVLAIVEG